MQDGPFDQYLTDEDGSQTGTGVFLCVLSSIVSLVAILSLVSWFIKG